MPSDSAKASAIVGPYLFGSGEDLTPVQIAAQDVNSDGKPDLVVSVKSEQLIYINDGASFRLMKLTSAVIACGARGTFAAVRSRAFKPSIALTRGSERSLACSWS